MGLQPSPLQATATHCLSLLVYQSVAWKRKGGSPVARGLQPVTGQSSSNTFHELRSFLDMKVKDAYPKKTMAVQSRDPPLDSMVFFSLVSITFSSVTIHGLLSISSWQWIVTRKWSVRKPVWDSQPTVFYWHYQTGFWKTLHLSGTDSHFLLLSDNLCRASKRQPLVCFSVNGCRFLSPLVN